MLGGSLVFDWFGFVFAFLVGTPAGVTQLEQSKFLFNKLNYQLSSQQILGKLSAKQGMPMTWDQIKRASVQKEAFILFVSKAQLIYLPHRIFNSDNEVKFFETILKRKGYIKQ